jgi:hypothetical protein
LVSLRKLSQTTLAIGKLQISPKPDCTPFPMLRNPVTAIFRHEINNIQIQPFARMLYSNQGNAFHPA